MSIKTFAMLVLIVEQDAKHRNDCVLGPHGRLPSLNLSEPKSHSCVKICVQWCVQEILNIEYQLTFCDFTIYNCDISFTYQP